MSHSGKEPDTDAIDSENQVIYFRLALICRVSKEQERNELSLENANLNDSDNSNFTEANLSADENLFYDLIRSATHNSDRLMYIYVFTAIIITTVIITLIRSFIFFNVSILAGHCR